MQKSIFNAVNISKKYHSGVLSRQALQDVCFSVKRGEKVCVLGKSGSGKTTLLRVLAGLEAVESGKLTFDRKATKIGYVSQEYTLWPHRNVLDNLTLAPSLAADQSINDLKNKAVSLLERFDLSEHIYSYPFELSGGQRQRVAVLRALMINPDLLLFDEVTSALDPALTQKVFDIIRAVSKGDYTTVLVTHQLALALSTAERVLFMDSGEIIMDGSPSDFLQSQDDPRIHSFIAESSRKEEDVKVFSGVEQFQAYHLGLIRRLPAGETISVIGAVGDRWYDLMSDVYEEYEKIRIEKKITWQMIAHDLNETDHRLLKEYPEYNKFRRPTKRGKHFVNSMVFDDTVIIHVYGDDPSVIEIGNACTAESCRQIFKEVWELSK